MKTIFSIKKYFYIFLLAIPTFVFCAEGGLPPEEEEFIEVQLIDNNTGKQRGSFLALKNIVDQLSIAGQLQKIDTKGKIVQRKKGILQLYIGSPDVVQPEVFDILGRICAELIKTQGKNRFLLKNETLLQDKELRERSELQNAINRAFFPSDRQYWVQLLLFLDYIGYQSAYEILFDDFVQHLVLLAYEQNINTFMKFIEEASKDTTLTVKLKEYFLKNLSVLNYVTQSHSVPIEKLVPPITKQPLIANIEEVTFNTQVPWRAAIVNKDRSITVANIEAEFRGMHTFEAPALDALSARVYSLSPDGNYIAMPILFHPIELRDVNTGALIASIPKQQTIEQNRILFSPNQKYLVFGSTNTITIWDLETNSKYYEINLLNIKQIQFLTNQVIIVINNLAPSLRGKDQLNIVSLPDKQHRHISDIRLGNNRIECLPDGKHIIFDMPDSFLVFMLENDPQKLLAQPQTELFKEITKIEKVVPVPCTHLNFSSHGNLLAYSLYNYPTQWQLLDITNKQFGPFITEQHKVLNVAFHSTGNQLCVATEKNLIFYTIPNMSMLLDVPTLEHLALVYYIDLRKFKKQDEVVKIPEPYNWLVVQLPVPFQKFAGQEQLVLPRLPARPLQREAPLPLSKKELPHPYQPISVPQMHAEPGLPELLKQLHMQLKKLSAVL